MIEIWALILQSKSGLVVQAVLYKAVQGCMYLVWLAHIMRGKGIQNG